MKALAIIALGVAATASSCSVMAQGLSLQLHGISLHTESRDKYDRTGRDWNERNYGGGLRYTFNPDWSVQAGVYRNSIDRTTVYGLATYTPLHIGPVRVGVFGGLATGYNAPVIGGVALELGPVTIRVVPKIKGATPLVFGVEVGIPF
jgi:hypothetical protein